MLITESGLTSDQALLRDCAAGDGDAWQRLLDQYEALIYSIPLNYGLAREDAADIVQITFSALLGQIDSLRPDSNVGGWLATVARRHTWRIIERKKRTPTVEFDSEATAALLPERTSAITRWEMTEWLHAGLTLLGQRCRDLLTALYLEEHEPSYVEVAQRLGLAVGSIGATRALSAKLETILASVRMSSDEHKNDVFFSLLCRIE